MAFRICNFCSEESWTFCDTCGKDLCLDHHLEIPGAPNLRGSNRIRSHEYVLICEDCGENFIRALLEVLAT